MLGAITSTRRVAFGSECSRCQRRCACPHRVRCVFGLSRSFRYDRGKSSRCKRSARYSPSDILGRAGDGSIPVQVRLSPSAPKRGREVPCLPRFSLRQTRKIGLMTSSPISLEARYAASRSAPPGGTRSKGSRILTVVPGPSDPDGTIVPPS